jgi:hypothetical protein
MKYNIQTDYGKYEIEARNFEFSNSTRSAIFFHDEGTSVFTGIIKIQPIQPKIPADFVVNLIGREDVLRASAQLQEALTNLRIERV